VRRRPEFFARAWAIPRGRNDIASSLAEGPDADADRGWRLPANEIERTVAAAAATLLEGKSALVTAIQQRGIETHRIMLILEQASVLVD
jgi:hypothetical protein